MEQILQLSDYVFSVIKKSLGEIEYNSNNRQQSIIISFYGVIIEGVSTCLLLIKHKHEFNLPLIIRNILEAYIDLKNIIIDEHYLDNLYYDYFENRKKFFESAVENPIVINNKKTYILYNSHIDELKLNLTELKGKKIKKLLIRDKFEKAGLLSLYNDYYNILCQESHNGLYGLETRHFIEMDNGLSIHILKPQNEDKILLNLFKFMSILFESFKVVQVYFKKEDNNYSKIISKKFDEFEDLMKKSLG